MDPRATCRPGRPQGAVTPVPSSACRLPQQAPGLPEVFHWLPHPRCGCTGKRVNSVNLFPSPRCPLPTSVLTGRAFWMVTYSVSAVGDNNSHLLSTYYVPRTLCRAVSACRWAQPMGGGCGDLRSGTLHPGPTGRKAASLCVGTDKVVCSVVSGEPQVPHWVAVIASMVCPLPTTRLLLVGELSAPPVSSITPLRGQLECVPSWPPAVALDPCFRSPGGW